MKIIALLVLFSLISFTFAQTTSTGTGTATSVPPSCVAGATYCEACLSANQGIAGCGWCQAATYGTCVASSTCTYITGAVFFNDPANCTTCTASDATANYCEFTDSTFDTTKLANCLSTNTPASTTTIGTVAITTTTHTCSVGTPCLQAAYGLACSYFCSACNVSDPSSIGQYKYCQPQCDYFNNVACADEIANGCATAVSSLSCTANLSTCNPWINASASAVGGSGTSNTNPTSSNSPTVTVTISTTGNSGNPVSVTASSSNTNPTTVSTVAATTSGSTTVVVTTKHSGALSTTVCAALILLLAVLF